TGATQPTSGKADTPEHLSSKPLPNRWQPTATVLERMVRRGRRFKSVRGLEKAPAKRPFELPGRRTRGHIPDTSAVRARQRDVARRLLTVRDRLPRTTRLRKTPC